MTSSSPINRPVSNWLLFCCALVFAIIVLGGTVRLTRSGLSITEWNPVAGVVPPLSEGAWTDAFDKYKATPEFQLHPEMTRSQFEFIYWMEFAHRFVARAIGAVFLFPLLWFLLRRRVDRRLGKTLVAIFLLGGMQGAVGWFMVKSGLVDEPRVSPYRLAVHLMLAVVLFLWMLNLAWKLRGVSPLAGADAGLRARATSLVGLVLITMTSGAFVAGTRAGFYFNTFPTMGGRLIPEGFWRDDLGFANLFENVATVQFFHRCLAFLIVAEVLTLWWKARRSGLSKVRHAGRLVLAAGAVQVTLGITTLLLGVPIPVASAHQAGAVLLLTAAAWARAQAPTGSSSSSPS